MCYKAVSVSLLVPYMHTSLPLSEGDCWAVGTAIAQQLRRKRLEDRIVRYEPGIGAAALLFFKTGRWRVVTIDDRLPVLMSTFKPGRVYPVYGECKDARTKWDNTEGGNVSLWFPLLEKASILRVPLPFLPHPPLTPCPPQGYAKMHGCYQRIDGGLGRHFSCDVSGGQSRSIKDLFFHEVAMRGPDVPMNADQPHGEVSLFPSVATCDVFLKDPEDGSEQRHKLFLSLSDGNALGGQVPCDETFVEKWRSNRYSVVVSGKSSYTLDPGGESSLALVQPPWLAVVGRVHLELKEVAWHGG